MKALIIGCGGQDGRYLTKACEALGWEVRGICRDDYNYYMPIWLETHSYDYIFHLASGPTADDTYLKINHKAITTVAVDILEAVLKRGYPTKVFFAGSAKQFQNFGDNISEFNEFVYDTPYAIQRNYITHLARYYRTKPNLKVYVGYLFHHESPFRKSHHVSRVIADAAKRAMAGEKFTMEFGGLDTVREWTFAGDTVRAMLRLVEQDDVFEACIGSGDGFSIENWAQACFDLGGLKWRDYIKDDPKFVSSYDRLVSDSTLMQSLGWAPQVDFYQLAEMMVNGT